MRTRIAILAVMLLAAVVASKDHSAIKLTDDPPPCIPHQLCKP